MRYVVLNTVSNTVENIIEWDGRTQFSPPTGTVLRLWTSPADIGSTWDGRVYSAPPPPSPSEYRIPKLTMIDRLVAAKLLPVANSALGPLGSVQRERWIASDTVDPTNADVIALLTAIGGDLASLLAPA